MSSLWHRALAGLTALAVFVTVSLPVVPAAADQRKLYFYHPDHLGSTNVVTDERGQVVDVIEYKPFGEISRRDAAVQTVAHTFTGQRHDASTGLAFYHARYYDPQLARFIQPDTIVPVPGVFDPEKEYGAFPPGIRARGESTRARLERKRGISVPELPCPALVVYGDEFAGERGRRLAACYRAEDLYVPGRSHWDLVLDPEVVRAVAERTATLFG